MAKITDVEGIGPVNAEKLGSVGLSTTAAYLKKCCEAKGRKEVSEATGISTHMLLEWANRVDLMRVKGIGTQYSDLLEASGVDSVPELAQRNAANLQAKLAEVNAEKKMVRRVPSLAEVSGWVSAAKELPKVVTH